ncbi:glycosyltransferase family 61 protein [Muricoccus radiodurans]|uniref:glycosyltransferase family 61 protein n=1 Tax=Muricoccus radiodurans TaxID=2231721 RepID=UPI003CE7F191
MVSSYSVAPVSSIDGLSAASSRISKAIIEDHRRFFGGQKVFSSVDNRRLLEPLIGAHINDASLADRWRAYDENYRTTARVSRFWITEIPEATVFPGFGIVAAGNTILKDTVRNGDQLRSIFPGISPEHSRALMSSPANRVETNLSSPTRRIPGKSFHLGFGMFENYYNWMLRYASRIALYQAMEQPLRLIVPERKKRYIPETLEFFGVREDDVHFLTRPTIFERLVLVSPIALGRYELSPLMTQTLRSHPRVTGLWRQPKKKIYIPRRNVEMRSITNSAEVEALMKRHGFLIFDNAENPVSSQVRAFRDASIVVGAHGAGLSNIVFSDPETQVIEIVPEGYDQGVTSYRSLSDLFGLQYTQLFGKEVVLDRKGNRCNSDIEIDLAELSQVLKTLGAMGS